MRVGILGAGAIGSLIAARLAEGGSEVICIDRGVQLGALEQNGLTLIERDGARRTFAVRACAALADAGPLDWLVLAVKAHEIPDLAADVAAFDERVPILTVQNGIPWWYFQKLASPHAGRVLESVDPGGVIAAAIDPGRIVGCVAYPAAEIVEPGIVRHVEGSRFPLGELDGVVTARAQALSAELTAGGLKAPLLEDIRSELWLKAWGNCAFNPISALTGMTMAEICRFPSTRRLAVSMMREAESVASALGVRMRVPLERRLAGAEQVGDHKTSMLQDLEQERALEIGAVLSAIVEIADEIAGVPTPVLRTVEALLAAVDPGRTEATPAAAPSTPPAET